jgi:putative peptidoglycan binding protein/CHAP domain-containing protein
MSSTGAGVGAPIAFPGHLIRQNEKDSAVVMAIQHRLNSLGCGPIDEDGDFGRKTKAAVKLFQIRFTDNEGLPLKVDGEIGPITWSALFGAASVPSSNKAVDELLARSLEVAASQVGVREDPPGSNRGPEVDRYVKAVGLNPEGEFPWCAAFVYFCFDRACEQLGRANPLIKTAGTLDHWSKAGARGVARVTAAEAKNDPSLVKAGQIFIIHHSGSAGHTGLVESTAGGKLVTIEGNSNEGGSREGIGVFRLTRRKIVDINKGFIDYAGR